MTVVERSNIMVQQHDTVLSRRQPYKVAKHRVTYWYDPTSGDMIFPDGVLQSVGVFSLTRLLDGIRRNCKREHPQAKDAILFLRAGHLAEHHPPKQWFTVFDEWSQEKFLWKHLTATYRHTDKFTIDLRATGNFFDEEQDLSLMRQAYDDLASLLRQAFYLADDERVLLDTPAATGRELLQISLPKHVEYPRLPDNIATLLYHNVSYQSRVETFSVQRPILEHGVHVLDGRWMYASCLSHLPVGDVLRDHENRFAGVRTKAGKLVPICPGFYSVTVTVPDNWQHIGLIKEQPKNHDDEGSYPNTPGYTFSNWISAAECALLFDNSLHIPWQVTIHERLLWPDTNSITDPLATWARHLRDSRAQVEHEQSATCRLEKTAIRAIVLHTIGSFLQVFTTEDCFTSLSELPLAEDPYRDRFGVLHFQLTPHGVYWKKARQLEGFRQKFIHPEWSATVYGRARAKLVEFALRLPYQDIISLRTDSVWCASCPEWLDAEDTGKPGVFREKEYLTEPFVWPVDALSMRSFIVKHHNAQHDDETLQQEVIEEGAY